MPPDLFWAKVDKSGECWLWTAAIDDNGYGRFMPDARRSGDRRTVLAHRFAYELLHGPLGDDRTHHTCPNRHCVRHVRRISQREHLALHPKPRDARGRFVG